MQHLKNINQDKIREWLGEIENKEIQDYEIALNNLATANAKLPPAYLKEHILGQISSLNENRLIQGKIDIKNPPLIHKDSNIQDWINAIEGLKAPIDFDEIHLEPIRSDETVEMFIAWASTIIPEEVHDNILESFLILEGSCTCHIKDQQGNLRIVHMQAGDFITMGIGETHDLHITSEQPTKAILQWLKIAA
ncbi:MAG: AraC family ligand binding domain-containing protein [Saprospiraceae bacterium]|nr:AraC family ligand binding domain-containing protein [Saprospiraceae bacterium]MBK8450869.1 AraC family ligand binding domain-containing protein [Saprospiraceae bacterium]MBK9223145.1 AraC family ligand binding domain-containing protein [Saprospiraceae bacterium]MBK9720675.1 AraC family ligand binding domain-containing protein [Saprospiraceae bacterium]MBK9727664.1 AraC family ligand binding domain-containing protein [Saprospiraceae bacterium]